MVGGGDHIGNGQRARMHAPGDQTGEVGHVDHQDSPDLVGDFPEFPEIDKTGIGRTAGDDQFRFMFDGQFFQFIKVDLPVLFAHPVLDGIKPFS